MKDLQCSCVKGRIYTVCSCVNERTYSVAVPMGGITVQLCQVKDLHCSCVKLKFYSAAESKVGFTV